MNGNPIEDGASRPDGFTEIALILAGFMGLHELIRRQCIGTEQTDAVRRAVQNVALPDQVRQAVDLALSQYLGYSGRLHRPSSYLSHYVQRRLDEIRGRDTFA
mgnify:FL=1